MDQERYPDAEERMPDAPTGDPERAERERESQEEPDTKFHQYREAEQADRESAADDLASESLTERDDT
jgi:hypothetical protein